jgi:lysophospholipase L1-like esterase
MISYGRLFFILGILGLACLGLTDADAQTPSTRFLPLGDSLTEGVETLAFPGSYRNRLHQLLGTAGFNVDFIGNRSDANNPTLPDTDHEGHGGFKIDQIQSGISSGWLDSVEDPDVILLLIGTNDFSANNPPGLIETRFSNLIADLATRRPFAKIIVSTLPPRTDDPVREALQMDFNAAIPGIVDAQVALGRHVSHVDIHSALELGDMVDGIHPGEAGCEKMANVWMNGISSVITPLGSSDPPAIVRAGPPSDTQHVTVRFSKPLADSAATVSNFSIDGGLVVSGAILDSTKRIITLTTSTQTPGSLYTITVSGVEDRTPEANVIAPGSTVTFSTNTPANGSFESDFADWTHSGNLSIQSASPYAATDGGKLVAFNDGNLSPNGVLSQSFPTIPGQAYTLAFDAGAFGSAAEQRLQVAVTGGGSLFLQTLTFIGPGGTGTDWASQAFFFTADSTTTTLTFTDVSTAGTNVDLVLDHVRVTAQVARTLEVATSPVGGVQIDVTPADLNGAGSAAAGFTRQYPNDTLVALTAPASSGGNAFVKWRRNGVDFTSRTTATLTVDADDTLTAVYAPQMTANGGFESALSGWTFTGSLSIQSASPYSPTEGATLVAFNDGNLVPNGVLSQTFPTVTGQTYTVAFDVGILAYNLLSQNLEISVTGTSPLLTELVTLNGTGSPSPVWESRSFTFVADGSSATLRFRDVSAATAFVDLLLDNVRVFGPPQLPIPTISGTPENLAISLLAPFAGNYVCERSPDLLLWQEIDCREQLVPGLLEFHDAQNPAPEKSFYRIGLVDPQ